MKKLHELLTAEDLDFGEFVKEMAEMPPASLKKLERFLEERMEEIEEDIGVLQAKGNRGGLVSRAMDLIWVARRLAIVKVLLEKEGVFEALMARTKS